KCLAALEAQTVSKDQFEVVVIDDGSSDGTEAFMKQYEAPFRVHSLRQKNSGTGTARRHGVEHATGEYLLLMNDDTICTPNVIEEHLSTQQRYSSEKWAVLGNFRYPEEARRRAMTHFFCVNSFMFPQVDMEAGCPYGYSHFITCNLSVRREAVLEVGSFDGTYMLSEDTEMGIKLFELGYSVIYHPAAHAWHDHAQYAVPNLIRRARVYGGDYFHMFRNHPRVMREWLMPVKLTGMNPENAFRIRDYVEEHRQDVKAAVDALSRWDTVDFEPVLANKETTSHVLSLFQQSVPVVHWFHLFEKMLEVMAQEFQMPELTTPQAMHAAAK
ncbi:MAG TPA: glycosyltransferase, partial [Terriglobales bacterium]|nr:glycosyltransferase [Terriglobales bacterium]